MIEWIIGLEWELRKIFESGEWCIRENINEKRNCLLEKKEEQLKIKWLKSQIDFSWGRVYNG
jgi:hypothetical protein